MKTLAILRHGEKGTNGLLTKKGCLQVTELAEKLAAFTEGNVFIVYSPTARTWQTAEIISSVMKEKDRQVVRRQNLVLCPTGESVDLKGIKKIVNKHKKGVLILVTHSVVLEKLSPFKSENCMMFLQ